MSYLCKKRIFAVVFLVVLLVFAAINAVYTWPALAEAVDDGARSPTQISSVLTEEIWLRMPLVETYSLSQVLLGKREFSDFKIIKDEDGYLHYSNFYKERNNKLFEYAHRVMRLQKAVEEKGTKVIFVATPSKFLKGEVRLERGLRGNDPYDSVQELLVYLYRMGIHTLDLSQIFSDSDEPYLHHFFKTDHHWNAAAAFLAAQLLVEDLRETFGDDLDPTGFYMNPDNYSVTRYEGRMLGTMGRRTGIFFSGREAFELYTPRFENRYYRIAVNGNDTDEYEGNYEEALLKLELLEEDHDIYRESMYDIYLDGINDYDHIENLSRTETENKRILFINDSYFSPVISFMAPMCASVDKVYNRSTEESANVERLLEENTYDYVIIEVYPYNLDEEAFNYFIRGEESNG